MLNNGIPFTELEKVASKHAILMGMTWLIILPTGTLMARYLRTYTSRLALGRALFDLR